MSRSLRRFQRTLSLGVRECQLALFQARQALDAEQRRERLLTGQRDRHEQAERERRRGGCIGSLGFTHERTRALIERSLEKCRERLALRRGHAEVARQALADARRRESAVGRLIERKDRQERQRIARKEQNELDEVAQRIPLTSLTPGRVTS